MTQGRRWSIRRRLTRRTLGLVIGGWIGTILIAGLFIRYEMNEILDEELQTVAEAAELFLDDVEGPTIPRTIGLTSASGERVMRVLRPGETGNETPWPDLTADGLTTAGDWRVLRRTTLHGVIEVGHALSWRREEVMEASSSLLILVLPLVAALAVGLGRLLRRVLAPLERLARTIAARAPQDLSPVPDSDLPQEAQSLVTAMNGYIARIESLRQAERRFIANAAHELRTPIAALRMRLELSGDPDARAAVRQLDALTHRIERLLQLSRAEAGLGLGEGPADLIEVLRLTIDEVSRAGSHPIRLDDADIESLLLTADPDALAILLRNLLENAVMHGTGPVLVRLEVPARISIVNPTLGTSFAEQPFQKGAGSSGTGLGLSIVAELATGMGLRIDRRITEGQARVTVDFSACLPQAQAQTAGNGAAPPMV